MPLYEFHCGKCGQRFEQLVKLHETPSCPACGAAGPERLFSSSAAVSTTRTRGRAIAEWRSKSRAVKQEKDHAHQEYLRNEMKDHS